MNTNYYYSIMNNQNHNQNRHQKQNHQKKGQNKETSSPSVDQNHSYKIMI